MAAAKCSIAHVQKQHTRLPQLDGLRGVAIGLIIFGHLGVLLPHASLFFRIKEYSWCGVDLFFVLSGYLIGGILIDNKGAKNYFRVFYARRFLRIIPPYALLLLGGTIFLRLIGVIDLHAPWYSFVTMTQNLYFSATNKLDIFRFGHTWSLAVEEQFYFTFPLLVWVLPRRWLMPVTTLLAVAIAASRCFAVTMGYATPIQIYVLPYFHGDALLVGVLCALIVRHERASAWISARPKLLAMASVLLTGGFIATGGNILSGDKVVPTIGLLMVELQAAILLLVAVLIPQSFPARLLCTRWLVQLGTLAYVIYLVQPFVVAVCVVPAIPYIMPVVAIAATVIISHISWNCIESPLVAIGHRFRYAIHTHDFSPPPPPDGAASIVIEKALSAVPLALVARRVKL